jgi:hypothetical protein
MILQVTLPPEIKSLQKEALKVDTRLIPLDHTTLSIYIHIAEI